MSEKTLFKGATVIDGTGAAPVKADLLIEGKDILEVGNVNCPDAKVVDVSGKVIMPGLINCHVHCTFEGDSPDPFGVMSKETDAMTALRGARNLKKLLRSGVTFFRDMGARNHICIDLRNARNQGIIDGPEFIVAGKPITMTGGHAWMIGRQADGCDEVRKATREQLRAGVDFIKIMATGGVLTPGVEPGAPQLTFEEIQVAVEEANKAGKKTATHAQGSTGIMNTVRAGIDSVEHGFYLTDEIIDLMLKKGTFLVPTLNAVYAIVAGGIEAGMPAFVVEKAKKVMEDHRNSFRMAYKAGVKIAMGPDSGTPFNRHNETFLEIKMMVDCGMSVTDALLSTTKNAAELLGITQRYGTLEKGKASDFLVLGTNPVENIDALQNSLECVYKLGKLVD